MTPAGLRLIAVSVLLYLCSPFFPAAHAQSGPAIQSINPDAVPAGGPETFITVKGSGFNPSSVIAIDYPPLSLPTTFIDEGTLQAVIPYRSISSPGTLFIRIKNADTGAFSQVPFPFVVFSREPPVVSSVDVSGAPPGATFRMTLSGSHLALAQISFSGSGITVVPSGASEIRAWVDVSVAVDAPFGPQTMTITTRAGSTSTCGQQLCSFTVLADVGSWMPTGPVHDTRWRATIVRLLDGRVLIAGGGSIDARQAAASAEIFDPATLEWTPTLPMSVARLNATGTLLPDGRVLVAGGSDGSQALSSVEIFDPVSLSWSAAGSMTSNYPAKAFLLSDGRVFLFHPTDGNGTRPGELFDPVRGTFQPLPATTAATPFASAAAVLLSSGKVLLVRVSAGPAVYDPATNTYSVAHTDCGGPLRTWLRLLPDSRVLCRETNIGPPGSGLSIPSALIYDPRTDTAKPATPAAPGEDVLLSNGLVRIGGAKNSPAPGVGPNILYDPSSDQIIAVPAFAPDALVVPDSMTLLDDGRALAVGLDVRGNSLAAVFSPPAYNNPAPSLSAVTGNADSSILDIRGGAFLPNSFVQIGSTKLVTLYLGSKRLAAFVPPALRSTISSGVSVVNPGPGGGPTDRIPLGFLAPQPVITSFTPNTARQASQVNAVISGRNLVNVVSVSFAPGDVSATVQPAGDASTLNLSINVDGGAAIGSHSVTVETGSGATTFANALQIQRSPPPNTLPLPINEVETGSPRSGYAVVTPDSGSSMPQATLTFGLVQNGILQSQAAVLPNAPVDHAVISADIVPGIGRYVAFAIVNTGSVAASISLTLRDEDGNVAATTSLTLQSRQQIAKFVSEILSVGAAFRGNLTIQSSTPVYIVGLRFTGPVMSTITISGTAASQTNSNSLVFPQFALGGGSATTLALVNDSTSTITGRVDIFDQSGNPMAVRLNGATQSTFSYTIAPRGSLTFAPRDSNGQSPF